MVFYDRGRQRWNRWFHRYTRPKDIQKRWDNRKKSRRGKKKLDNRIYYGLARMLGAKNIEQRKSWSKLIIEKEGK